VPDVARGPIQTIVGDANAVPGAAAHPAANPLAAIGATQAAATENVAKVTHVLDSVSTVDALMRVEFCASTAEFCRKSPSAEEPGLTQVGSLTVSSQALVRVTRSG
jgi:hypothetical protein